MEIIDQIINFENEFGVDAFIEHVRREFYDEYSLYHELIELIIDTSGLFTKWNYKFSEIPPEIFEAIPLFGPEFIIKIKFHSPYFAARVIGKNGHVIKRIKQMSNTEIVSPWFGHLPQYGHRSSPGNNRILFKHSSASSVSSTDSYSSSNSGQTIVRNELFEIMADDVRSVRHCCAIILETGLFFYKRFQEIITPQPGQKCRQIPVNPEYVSFLLFNNGQRIKLIQMITSVRIVSPKPYSPPCFFYLIGNESDLDLAQKYLQDFIKKHERYLLKQQKRSQGIFYNSTIKHHGHYY